MIEGVRGFYFETQNETQKLVYYYFGIPALKFFKMIERVRSGSFKLSTLRAAARK